MPQNSIWDSISWLSPISKSIWRERSEDPVPKIATSSLHGFARPEINGNHKRKIMFFSIRYRIRKTCCWSWCSFANFFYSFPSLARAQCLSQYEYRQQRFRIEIIMTHHFGCGRWQFRCENVLPMTMTPVSSSTHYAQHAQRQKDNASNGSHCVRCFFFFSRLRPMCARWMHANMLHVRHSNTKTMRRKLPWRPTIRTIPFRVQSYLPHSGTLRERSHRAMRVNKCVCTIFMNAQQ